jgi:filamentous hemagglutinin family protein
MKFLNLFRGPLWQWPLSVAVSWLVWAEGMTTLAQPVGDNTLGPERSQVIRQLENGVLTDVIRGGATRGQNLFHSFEQFSVERGSVARFDNDGAIANIISRVTGSSASNIDGLIRANGMANLFLINPNGIVFGADARLDIGGSFIASTASGIAFPDGFVYGTEAPASPPLLTVSTPVGLQLGNQAADIRVVGNGDGFPDMQDAEPTSVGLGVNDEQTLALIGGNILIDGGTLRSSGGRIELGSVAAAGDVGLMSHRNGFTTSFDDIDSFGTIQLANQSIVDASGTGGGAIRLRAGLVDLSGGSAIRSDTLGAGNGRPIAIATNRFRLSEGSFVGAATFGEGDGGQIRVLATESARLEGEGINLFQTTFIFGALFGMRSIADRQGGLFTGTSGISDSIEIGDSGDIRITTPNLQLVNGAIVSADSLGEGDGGSIRIDGSRVVRMIGSGIGTNSLVFGVPLIDSNIQATGESAEGFPAGDAGDLTIQTDRLLLAQGAFIAAGTTGDGDAGDIRIRATESVELGAFLGSAFIPTNINSSTLGGTGDGGDIYIDTGRLVVRDGAEIFTSSGVVAVRGLIQTGGPAGNLTINASESVEVIGRVGDNDALSSELVSETLSGENAGIVTISTNQLVIRDGAQVSASTLNRGDGGSLIVNAQSVEVLGTSAVEGFPSGLFAASGDLRRRNQEGNLQGILAGGNAGALSVITNRLTVQDGAEIAVSSVGDGNGGDLSVTADSIDLDRQGSITAATESGDGGIIRLNAQDRVSLRRNSSISAQAGGDGDGGNIIIDASDGFVFAISSENSDIIASAQQGNGGNITITTQGIFGLEARSPLTELSDINASSDAGVDGVIEINQPEAEPTDGTVDLPTDVSAPPLAQGCGISSRQSQFVNVGRGGLPPNPAGALNATTVWQDLDAVAVETNARRSAASVRQADRATFDHQEQQSNEEGVREAIAPTPSLVEAQGWQVDSQGRVVLTAEATHVALDSSRSTPQTCNPIN